MTRYLRPYWVSLTIATIMAVLLGAVSAGVFSLIGPALKILMIQGGDQAVSITELFGARVAGLIDYTFHVREIKARQLWLNIPGMLVALAAIRAVLGTVQWFLWERAGELVSKQLRSEIVNEYMLSDPIRITDGISSLSGSITTDIRLTREYIVHFYGGLPRELLEAFFFVITLLLLSPQMCAVFFVGVLPALWVVNKMGKKLRRRSARALEDNAQLIEWLQQRLLGIETVKHYKTEELEKKQLGLLTGMLYNRFYNSARVKSAISPVMEFIAIFAMVFALYYALRSVATGGETGSVQLSFFSTLGVLAQSAAKIARYYNSNREAGAAIVRIMNLFENLRMVRKGKLSNLMPDEVSDSHALEMTQVSVRYPKSDREALSNFSYAFERGKIYCILGPSGSGKSTLFNTILGLIEPSQGLIRVFRRKGQEETVLPIVYVPQYVHLIPDTIALNVAYPLQNFDGERVMAALDSVGLGDYVRQLPSNISTRVGVQGEGVSGGQAQRILLARLFYHQAMVALIDEGTSALDPELESLFYGVLKKLADQGTAVLMITHRTTAIPISDKNLIIENGNLAC